MSSSFDKHLDYLKILFKGRVKLLFQPEVDFDPTARSTMCSIMIGGFFTGLAAFGTNQAVIQRALGTNNLSRARWSYVISGPLSLVTQVIAVALGLVVFSYYANRECDPLINKDITRPDQILPLYLNTVIDYPTVAGFFYGSVICASLSTISSSINAVAAILWENVLVVCFGQLSDLGQSIVRKIVAIMYGVLLIGAAFVLEENKQNTTLISVAFSVFGALQGPVLGMFLFAGLVPFSNGIGALFGGLCAAGVTTWMMVGRTLLGVYFQRLPVPYSGCIVPIISDDDEMAYIDSLANFTTINFTASDASNFHTAVSVINTTTSTMMCSPADETTGLEWFYSISFWYYSLIGVVIVFVVGTVVSLLT